MIAIEVDGSGEGVEMYLDKSGLDELIGYLQFIKSSEDHIHLVAGTELNEELVNPNNGRIKHAKLVYCED